MLQRILVADDAELNRALLREILEEDYIVDEACNGAETLEWLLEHRRHTAALLLDLRMPGMDGFSVIEEMKRNGWMNRIPVLIISSDDSVEVENRCLELGVSDFIHKPFDTSVVKNRVKNTLELFASKNQLETTVEEQAQTLKKQDQIIRFQAEKLREADTFHRLMMEYRAAIMEMETRFQILNAEFSEEYKRNPFESIKSRLKTPESIYEKLARKGFPMTVETIRERLADVAGVRVICSFPDDIYRLKELLIHHDDILLIREKDYIKNPKPSGYRSLHLILALPIYLSNEKKHVKVEVQFRTIAMDFWASLEHKLQYKKNLAGAEEILRQLKLCADSIEHLDYQMQEIRNQIDRADRGRPGY